MQVAEADSSSASTSLAFSDITNTSDTTSTQSTSLQMKSRQAIQSFTEDDSCKSADFVGVELG